MNHNFRLKLGSNAETDLNPTETSDETFFEHSNFINDISTAASNQEIYVEFESQTRDTKLELAPLEVILDLPINLGCFLNLNLELTGNYALMLFL